jgi:hypothetical protein
MYDGSKAGAPGTASSNPALSRAVWSLTGGAREQATPAEECAQSSLDYLSRGEILPQTRAGRLIPRRMTMKLYHFPSPNPQKVTFALKELGLDCEIIPVDLAKGEQKAPAFLAVNPAGRVPVLVDDGVTLTESQAILAYLGDKTGRLWPVSAARRAQALQWLFFLSQLSAQLFHPRSPDVARRGRLLWNAGSSKSSRSRRRLLWRVNNAHRHPRR